MEDCVLEMSRLGMRLHPLDTQYAFSSILFSHILDSHVFLYSLYNPDTIEQFNT